MKQQHRTILYWSLGILAVGTGAYFAFRKKPQGLPAPGSVNDLEGKDLLGKIDTAATGVGTLPLAAKGLTANVNKEAFANKNTVVRSQPRVDDGVLINNIVTSFDAGKDVGFINGVVGDATNNGKSWYKLDISKTSGIGGVHWSLSGGIAFGNTAYVNTDDVDPK